MIFEEAYDIFSRMWNTPFRFYHTKENHLDKILLKCDTIELKYFALFHDIIYNPYSNTNEEDSLKLFQDNSINFCDLTNSKLVEEMIIATQNHCLTSDKYINRAIEIDMSILDLNIIDLIKYEKLIFLEYQKINIDEYKSARIDFLSKFRYKVNIMSLIDYIINHKYSIGIYPGSFDPFHVGHLDILKKAERLFDKVILVRAINPEKTDPKFDMPSSIPNQIINHNGLITELFNNKYKYTMIRGIRNEYDIASEMNYMEWVKEINRDIDFIHIFCDQKNIKVSSSNLKNLNKFNDFNISKWIVK